MTQGIFIGGHRPKSKKAIREALVEGMVPVIAENTNAPWFPPDYEGDVTRAPMGTKIVFCGPNPHNDRRFYGTIERTSKGIVVK